LIQIKHRHGEIVLSCGRTMPAKQLAVPSRPGTISHVWSPYTWCLINICVAATPASPDLVQELLSGQNLKLEVVDSNFFDGCDVLALGSVRVDPRCCPSSAFRISARRPVNRAIFLAVGGEFGEKTSIFQDVCHRDFGLRSSRYDDDQFISI
jgi:hypothetical protein